jgi:hypothetical protein
VGLPMPAWRVIAQADAARTASVSPQQIRRDARFVEEDVGAGVVQRLGVLPVPTRRRNVRTPLLGGVYRFF